MSDTVPGQPVAVIAMAGRFPRAADVDQLWRNLVEGVDGLSTFTDDELRAAGVPVQAFRAPGYVRVGGVVDGVERFDRGFFGMAPREAAMLNPEHRLLLELAWEALEAGGHAPGDPAERVGVFTAAGINGYWRNLVSHAELAGDGVPLGNDPQFAATRVSYRLGLGGPSLNVQTACSSSLVAVHLACQSLLCGECDLALAGGASIPIPQTEGYAYRPGGIHSPDGRCHAYDAGARGTSSGGGAALVLLRRLEDALEDGDPVLAVIRGSAVNNDGAAKASYSAPARAGQAQVVAEALAMAQAHPEEVGYVEGHGSGTELGDPVEVQGLTDAFRAHTARTQFCALGTVKNAIGHLGAASGVAGLVKAVLAVRHGEIPPALHFATPNPRIGFAETPFFVNTARTPWTPAGRPRVAGVSSFGIGGTNAHVVLQEAPAAAPSGPSRPWQLLVLSAAAPAALDEMSDRLAAHLEAHPGESLADVAHTLRVGRRRLPYRRALVCRTGRDAAACLRARDAATLREGAGGREGRPAAFLFPGLGGQYAGMSRGLYAAEPVFRAEVDRCAHILAAHLGADVRDAILAGGGGPVEGGVDLRRMLGGEAARGPLASTSMAQAALFVVEYAMARLWMAWGVAPAAVAGHSLGEWAAAAVAGVFSLEDALALVARRARLLESLPPGAMLAVPLAAAALRPLLAEGASVAAVNAPEMCTVAGTPEAVARTQAALAARGVACRPVPAAHAFHSAAVQPLAAELREAVRRAGPRAPRIPVVSSVTGRLLAEGEAVDPAYWAGQLAAPVRFDLAVPALLAAHPDAMLLEVGPGNGLGAFAVASGAPEGSIVSSLRAPWAGADDQAVLLDAAARLWVAGVRLDAGALARGERRNRVPLPAYPWQKERCWVDRRPGAPAAVNAAPARRVWAGRVVAPRHRAAARPAAPASPSYRRPRPELPIPYRAPEGATQRTVADIWGGLLGIDGIGAADDLFSLGGHSLVAVQVASRVQRALGVELSLADIFGAPTVAGMAARVDQLRAAGATARPAGIRRLPRGGPLPLSHQQERVWLAHQEDPAAPLYNVTGALRVRGLRDLDAARRGLDEVVRRHEILRTAYRVEGGVVMQVPLEPAPVPLPVSDLRALPGHERDGEARRLAALEAGRPMDLEAGEVLRARLLRTGAESYVLVVAVHHIAIDVWSWDVFYREWELLYGAFSRGQPSPLPELPAQYADWAGWQRERLTPAEVERQLGYWREHLRGAPAVLNLPTDRPRTPHRRHAGRRLTFRFPEGTRARLEALGGREGVTVYMVLLAGLQAVLHRWSGQDDLVVGTLESNRTPPQAEALIGYFLNTFPVRSRVEPAATGRQLLHAARDATLAAHQNADMPMERLLEELRPPRLPGFHPLFQVLFTIALPVRLGPRDEAAGLSAGSAYGEGESVIVDGGVSKWDLTVVMAVSGSDVTGAIQYDSDLFDAETVERLAGDYRAVVEAIAADPGCVVAQVPLASRAAPAGPAPLPERPGTSAEAYLPPRTPVERLLATTWAEMLGAERVGLNDDFFALGGHSLLALRAAGRVKQELGVALPLKEVAEHPTVERLAARIEALRGGPAADEPVALAPVPRGAPLPLSLGQERLFFLSRLDPGDASYNMPFPIRLLGPLDARVLERAATEVVRRHEVLRTRFAMAGGQAVQVALPAARLRLPVVDLSGLAPDDRGAELVKLVEAEAERPFDLAAEAPIRLLLARLGRNEAAPILMLHHAAGDAWSMRVLVHEISVLYAAFLAGGPSPLPELPIQYADYAVWQRRRMSEERMAADHAWWRECLRGARPVALPADADPPARPTYAAGVCARGIPESLAHRLDALARDEKATPFMLMLAAYAVLLFRHGGSPDVVIGSPATNRGHPATQPLIGFFVNVVPLRLRLDGNPTFRSLLARARDTTSAALEHAEFPFERLAHEMGVERSSGRLALLQATLDVETEMRRGLQIPGVALQRVDFGIRRTKFDLEFKVHPEPHGRSMLMVYAAERMSAATVEGMMDDMCSILSRVAAEPDARVLDVAGCGHAPRPAMAAAEADFQF